MADVYAHVRIRLRPGARTEAIEGWHGGALHMRVVAPPRDNKANEAVVRLVAQALRVPRSRVSVITGARSRLKTLAIDGLTDDDVRERLS